MKELVKKIEEVERKERARLAGMSEAYYNCDDLKKSFEIQNNIRTQQEIIKRLVAAKAKLVA